MRKSKLTVGITMGDAAGIGPEVVLKALQDKQVRGSANFLIIGNSFVVEETARISKISLPAQNTSLFNVGYISKLVFGRSLPSYGRIALDCIKAALNLIQCGKIDLLITAPVNKHTIRQAGYPFKGHTEYLAAACKAKDFAMMLIAEPLKVVLASRHIALKEVPENLSRENIYQTLRLTVSALKQYFAVAHPRIAVCGLNPHSGEEGALGKEEAKIIRPAVIKARRLAAIAGPLPADSLFYSALQGKFDAVVAMYHDQGLIPIKMHAFHRGVNLTLGLPFLRTSPDHGTAYDIAGKNKANPGSMIAAIKLAVKIALSRSS